MLDDIRSYIEANLSDPDLKIGAIAGSYFISTRYLHSLFKDQPLSIAAYIRSRKLSHCRHDLRNTLYIGWSVSEIIARWGFHDLAHFSKMFKATFGVTPGAYRLRIEG